MTVPAAAGVVSGLQPGRGRVGAAADCQDRRTLTCCLAAAAATSLPVGCRHPIGRDTCKVSAIFGKMCLPPSYIARAQTMLLGVLLNVTTPLRAGPARAS